jgi:hypothetical protein
MELSTIVLSAAVATVEHRGLPPSFSFSAYQRFSISDP